jgi:hypothetical protein
VKGRSISADGVTWTDVEGPHVRDDVTLGRAKLSGLAAFRGDDGDVKVDQIGLPA